MENPSANPLITIVTITYNAASTLPATMKSIARQSFKDYEHLLIDGCSTDNTIEIARNLASEALRIISEPDNGLYDAMNKGLRLARGKFIIFLNAGDSFHSSDTLEEYAEAAGIDDTDIIYGDTIIVDSQRRPIGPRHKTAPEILTPTCWLDGMLICHQAFMVRRTIAPCYNLRWRFSSDYEWTLKCISNTQPQRCRNLKTVTIDYLNEGQTTANHRASLIERFRIMCQNFGIIRTLYAHILFLLGKK